MRNSIARAILGGLAALLAACGGSGSGSGGGDGGGGGGGGTNASPAFTSATTAMVTENTAGTVYTAVASDANGDAVTFSLAAGADSAVFQITSAGALSFRTPLTSRRRPTPTGTTSTRYRS